ncbi:50S ribosomal protein L21 [Candidatus Nucleicultrix amoebiphila]|uniref:50S ribosomal protein L21 n=1 Tax=Candidatus Nucleicultrix amoebiphila TaxID=1509244 RepID=UPI000A26FE4C|nr:50S ribosomal protein L21 [Candidatus Nucleicultrix amoebiphila]
MFAVIKSGGKQYKISPGDVITVEKLEGNPGTSVNLTEVLMVSNDKGVTAGNSLSGKSEIKAMIVEQKRGEKLIVFKKRRRQNSRRKNGHKQHLTCLWIEDIVVNGSSNPAQNKPIIKEKAVLTETKTAKKAKPSTASTKKPTKSAAKPQSKTESLNAQENVKKAEVATKEAKAVSEKKATTPKAKATEKDSSTDKKSAGTTKKKSPAKSKGE